MPTLSPGQSATFALQPWDYVTVDPAQIPGGTLAFDSLAPAFRSDQVFALTQGDFGPFGVPGSATITAGAASVTYTITRNATSALDARWSDSTGTALVRPDGSPVDLSGLSRSLGTNLLDFSTLTGYSIGSGGTIELVSANVPEIGKVGSSIKVTVPMGTTKSFDMPAWTAINAANSCLMLCIENQTLATTGSAVWYMTVDSGFANHYYTNIALNKHGLQFIHAGNNGTVNQWATGAGSPTFATLTDGRLNITAPAGEDLVMIVHGMYAAPYTPPVVQIIQDDGVASGYTELLPILNRYGFRAGFSIIKNLIGTAGYLTTGQMDQLYAGGHDMIPHGQFALDTYGTAELAIADIRSNAAYLRERGYTRGQNVYVYPNGTEYYSASDKTSIINYLKTAGFKHAYIASGTLNFTFRGVSNFNIPRYAVNAAVNTTTLLNNVDLAWASGRGMVLMLHAVVPSGAAGDQSNRSAVETIMDGLATRQREGKIVVRAPSEMF